MEQMLAFASVLAPIVTGFVQLIKRTFPFRKKFIPLFSFFVGILIGVLSFPLTELELTVRIWSGGLAGLAATGLYEAGKHSFTNKAARTSKEKASVEK
ncbi:hypothetical protein A374_09918 [Fictibacillus macauensis ZFHKF-1]|uniref:Holin n=1 Tax=Fictibacillus macauensis ZFHKF-1 TaxID=1196324 RepID=I8UF83_9BACL|nr:holin [Fictibacillus macauensis]EIT85545.1 hypothetical protein A374_09918 [Fictibacillus macauensis ZFHKF-1]